MSIHMTTRQQFRMGLPALMGESRYWINRKKFCEPEIGLVTVY